MRSSRRAGLLAGGVAIAATASLVTLAIVEGPQQAPAAASLAAAVAGDPVPDGGGGKGIPTPTPTGKGKGIPTPTPTGKGKGTPTATPTGKGKGKGGVATEPNVTTLAAARRNAGFRVRTLDGMPGARLERVTTWQTTFDTAPGRPTETVVTLDYSLGSATVSVTEVVDPLPAAGANFMTLAATGTVSSAQTKGADGVSIVVNFYARTPEGVRGVDSQTAHQVIEQLG